MFAQIIYRTQKKMWIRFSHLHASKISTLSTRLDSTHPSFPSRRIWIWFYISIKGQSSTEECSVNVKFRVRRGGLQDYFRAWREGFSCCVKGCWCKRCLKSFDSSNCNERNQKHHSVFRIILLSLTKFQG